MTRSSLSALAILLVVVGLSSCASFPGGYRSQYRQTRNPISLIPDEKTYVCAIHKIDGDYGTDGRTELIVLYLRRELEGGHSAPHLNYPLPYRKGERVFYALQPDFSLKELPLQHDVARTLTVDMVFSSEESAAIYREEIIPNLFKFNSSAP